jgi:RNA polymerase sigma-70 factor (ECF subfamily)
MTESHLSDGTLIERFAQGDETAMDLLVRRHLPRIQAQALRLSRDWELADDVTAHTLIRMNRGVGSFKGRSEFTTWLHKLVRNCYLDLRKKAMVRPTESLDQPSVGQPGQFEQTFESTVEGPYESAEREALDRALMKAVQQLPVRQRSLVMMFHADMLTYGEIADSEQIPVGTLKSRLHRARGSLRELLEPDRFLLGLDSSPTTG